MLYAHLAAYRPIGSVSRGHVRRTVLITGLLAIGFAAHSQPRTPAHIADLCDQGDFKAAFRLIADLMADSSTTPEQKAETMLVKARLFEEFVGSPRQASETYMSVAGGDLPAGHPLREKAAMEVSRLAEPARAYGAAEQRLQGDIGLTRDPDRLKAQIALIRDFMAHEGDESLLALGHYYLGVYFDRLGKYGKAHGAFRAALRLRPAFALCRPEILHRKRGAFNSWVRDFLGSAVRWTTAAVMICALILFYASKPWLWLTFRHFLAFVGAGILAFAAFWVVMWVTGQLSCVPPGVFSGPTFPSTAPTSYGSRVPTVLLRYFAPCLVGILVVATAATRIRLVWTKRGIVFAAALVLFTCMVVGRFYLHVDEIMGHYAVHHFISGSDSAFPCAAGTSCFRIKDAKPFVLTSPKAYGGLKISAINEPVFAEWLEEQYGKMGSSPGAGARRGLRRFR